MVLRPRTRFRSFASIIVVMLWLSALGCRTALADVLIASSSSNSVNRYAQTNGAFVGAFTPPVAAPSGLTFGPDGSFYVSTGNFSGRPYGLTRFSLTHLFSAWDSKGGGISP